MRSLISWIHPEAVTARHIPPAAIFGARLYDGGYPQATHVKRIVAVGPRE